ncbi:tudor domain-containing protein 7-like isoform X2 [Lineus longissimus]|uniref:tudor domain-containing protein 7-like isoform X2 n=1 Tax=Lineus longissimus TaxID=88925 RepID=UPI00315C4DDA
MDLSNVKSLLRAVVQSCKEGVPLSKLSGEYRVITGDHIPFKKLGYSTIDDFLRAIPDTASVRRNRDGDLTVYAVADESTAHLEKLIAKQKTNTKKRGRGGSRRPTARITRPLTHGGGRGGRGGAQGSYSRMPPRSNYYNSFPTAKTAPPPRFPQYSSENMADFGYSRKVLQGGGDKFGLSVSFQNTEQYRKPLLPTPQTKQGHGDDSKIHFSERYQVPPRFQRLVESGKAKGGSRQGPLETTNTNSNQPETRSLSAATTDNVSNNDVGATSDAFPRGDTSTVGYKSMLNIYLAKHKLSTPMYNSLETPSGFVSHVKVKGKTYGSRSIVKAKKTAEQLAAQSACEDLGISEALIESYTKKVPKKDSKIDEMSKEFSKVVVDTPNNEIKNRVRDLIATKPSGMWNTRFPIEYKEKYGENLPSNYGELLKSWDDIIRIEESAAAKTMSIYYPVSQSATKMMSTSSGAASRFEKVIIPPMKTYKAGDKLKVFISYTLHCNEFYVQEEASCIERIMEEIRGHYESRGCPKEITKMEEGSYCVAQFSDDGNWYRAKVISTRVSGKFETEGEVLYIDYGNTEFIPKSKMKRMLSSVAKEPAQAIKCSLHGVTPTEASWSIDCIREFCKLTEDQLLTVEVLDVIDDTCDISLGTDLLCINDVLVEKGYANQRLVEPDTLVIPDDENLDVFVSFINKTSDVVVRLVGPNYSELLEDLEEKMERFYTKKTIPPTFVRAGTLYALVNENDDGLSVNRVRAIHVDGEEVNVSFMDHGGRETVKVSQLRNLDNKFRKLPYQAITVSLSGLEEFETNEEILEKLLDDVLGKSCLAKVVSRSDRLSVILFDTSSENDVNVNNLLMETVSDQDLSPHLPTDGSLKEVYIIHIDPNGLFHLQVPGPGKQRLETMMGEIQAHFSKRIGADEFIANPEPGQIVCARDLVDSRWCRAEILQVLPDRKVEVYYVDYGNSEVTEISELRSPAKASPHTLSFPHQAVQCTLFGLPPPGKMWTQETVRTLEASIDLDAFVPIKTMTQATDNSPAEVVMFLFDENERNFIPLNEDILEFADDLEAEVNDVVFDDLDDVTLDESAEAAYRQEAELSDGATVASDASTAMTLDSLDVNISKLMDTTVDASEVGLNNWLVLNHTGVNDSLNTQKEENNNGQTVTDIQNISAIEPAAPPNNIGSNSNSNSGSIDSFQLPNHRTKSIDSTASFDSLSEPLSSMRMKYYHRIPIPTIADIPEVGSFFDIHVTWVCDPSNFAVVPYDSQKDLETLMSEMYSAYQFKWQHTNLTVFHKDQLYAAFYEDLWYRVVVKDLLPEEQTVSVQFVDYGDYNIVPMDTLQPLPGDFRELPLQAFRAELSGICPADGKAWSNNCEKRLRELLSDRDLVALIKDNNIKQGQAIKVKLVDTSDEENDVCIDDVLVNEGFAKYV